MSAKMKPAPVPTLTNGRLLGLPNEVLLQISRHLQHTVKERKPYCDLFNLALTGKRFPPIIREVLYTSPILESAKVSSFLNTLFYYPDLRSKVQSLTVKSKPIQEQNTLTSAPIAGLEHDLFHHCVAQVRTLPMDSGTKKEWIAYLGTETLDSPSLLLGITLTMLPKLTALYLGDTVLSCFPLFCSTTTVNDSKINAWASRPNMDFVLQTLGSQLTTLELPNDLRLVPPSVPTQIDGFSTHFPKLTTLVVPMQLMFVYWARQDIFSLPRNLRVLVVTRVHDSGDDHWITQIVGIKAECVPRFKNVHMVHVEPDGNRMSFGSNAAHERSEVFDKAGIVLVAHVPKCGLNGDEYFL